MGLPRGSWVTIEDQYDHDRRRVGPFPSDEAARAYCDAVNGAQLTMPPGGAPSSLARPTDAGVWNLATCAGYDVDTRLVAMLAAPDTIPLDPEGIAARHGARSEHEWQAEARAAIGVRACWCALLRTGVVPDVVPDLLDAYLHLGLERGRDLFGTTQHHGDATLCTCKVCGGSVLHLMVELESVGDAIHHYFAPLGRDDHDGLADGSLNAETCEGWVGGRAGLYQAGSAVCAYTGAEVGYLGIDHRLRHGPTPVVRPPAPPVSGPQPGDRIGAYQLDRPLGAGGMKQVWRARTASGDAVALAVVSQFDPAQFLHEVTLARRVASPHVARMLDGFITDDGLGVVVTELCDGLDLARYRQARDVTPGEAVALIEQMAAGLAAIHAAHVLHRDVKPSNAMLTRAGVKLIDFGLSLPATDARTSPAGVAAPAGTLPYMAPETMSGAVDARTDTYALGVSLFHLIAGHPPLPFLSPHGWLLRLDRAEPLPLDELRDAPVAVTAMIARLCVPERERRPFVADVVTHLRSLSRSLEGTLPPFVASATSSGATAPTSPTG